MGLDGMVFHLILHAITIVVAFGLFVLSALSYRRDRRIKILYITGAFLLFFIKEIIVAMNVFLYSNMDPVIVHPLNLIILVLFFAGVVK